MDPVDTRLTDLADIISRENPYGRIAGTVYVDAQAVVQWTRLNVLENVLGLVPPPEAGEGRFRVQDVAFEESASVISRYSPSSSDEIKSHLQAQSNLYVDGPLLSDTDVAKRALELQAQMFIMGGQGAPPAGSIQHMGEAESLAFIERLDPGSIFVTADKDAIRVARNQQIGLPVRPLAFAAGTIKSRSDLEELWKMLCAGRECLFAGNYVVECVEALFCNHLSNESAGRGPLNKSIRNACDVLDWMCKDLADLITTLPN